MESNIGEFLLGLVFIDGFFGFGEMEFECSPYLVGRIFVIPLSDITCKCVDVGNVDAANID